MTEHSNLTPRRLRTILGHFATGLTVITAATKGNRDGVRLQPAGRERLRGVCRHPQSKRC
ncbi:hypothetical protein [Arthrobacter sp. ISL-72]|uniref:hypothetical protein n=1 Tax=Arthrobacter sp. ISL-72 TaxID=2819114 RepID=UPI002035CA4A|nr:hypothetical protein [Arthrobacter sp. ISL-72]